MKTNFFRINMFFRAKPETFRAASILRKNMTLAEKILWKKLNDRKLFKTKFRKQHPLYIFIVDFYCHEYKLVIEVDGEIHNNKDSREYDLGRTATLNRFGIKVIRFTNDQILYDIDSVIAEILRVLSDLTPL
jgi:very-short-patch-repair endonuclease